MCAGKKSGFYDLLCGDKCLKPFKSGKEAKDDQNY
jgi:hypothetical protein